MKRKVVVGITGASGALYAKLLLDKLAKLGMGTDDVALVFTTSGEQVFRYELGDKAFDGIGFKRFDNSSFFAPFASGSSDYDCLLIAPCTMGMLGCIASGLANDLISRTADVMLKERRKLILLTRETPLNMIQINNMAKVTEAGGIVCPASPSFYSSPKTVEELAQTVVDRMLRLAGFEFETYQWGAE